MWRWRGAPWFLVQGWRAPGLRTLGVLVLAVLLPAACSREQPDLEHLYAMTVANPAQPPVVLVHGIMGSRLHDRQERSEVWPGSLGRVAWSDYPELALPIDAQSLLPAPSALEPFAITDAAVGRDFYGHILQTLTRIGGYRQAAAGRSVRGSERRVYVFLYDWRQDNVTSARALDDLIETIRRDYRQPALRVDLIAHSMGGLLVRYYARYGRVDVLNSNEFPVNLQGAAKLRRVVLVGTPNLGAITSLQTLLEGQRIGLGRVPPEVLATFPSMYQLLPHPINDWLVTADGRMLERDLFDIEIWRRFEWGIFDPVVRARVRGRHVSPAAAEAYLALLERYMEKHLERARRFVWSLTVAAPGEQDWIVMFGGDCEPTPARILVEEVDGESQVALYPQEVQRPAVGVDYERLMLEPGDGVVTKPSLLARTALDPGVPRHQFSHFALKYPVLFCEQHNQLPGNLTFQDNLLHILLSVDERG